MKTQAERLQDFADLIESPEEEAAGIAFYKELRTNIHMSVEDAFLYLGRAYIKKSIYLITGERTSKGIVEAKTSLGDYQAIKIQIRDYCFRICLQAESKYKSLIEHEFLNLLAWTLNDGQDPEIITDEFVTAFTFVFELEDEVTSEIIHLDVMRAKQ